jgi:hypothetical protein
MTIELKDEAEFCDRLKKLGYTEHNRIRIYGEEFDLTSNPIMEEDGFAVEAICMLATLRPSCKHRQTRR